MGFLDNLNLDDPKTQLLLQMGLGLLGGAPGQRKNFGADFAHAGQQGLLGYAGAKSQQAKLAEEAQQSQLRQVQIAQAQQGQADQQAQRGLAERAFAPAGGYPGGMTGDDNGNPMPPNPMNPGGGGMAEYIQGMTRLNPQAGLAMQAQLAALNQKERVKVAPGETIGTYNGGKFNADYSAPDKPHFVDVGGSVIAVDPRTGQPVGQPLKKGMSPDAMATDARARERFAYDKEQGGKPQVISGPNGEVFAVDARSGTGAPVMGPDGQPLNKGEKPLTETQGNAAAFGMRAASANKIVDTLEKHYDLTDLSGNLAKSRITNIAAPVWAQSAQQAKLNFMSATLRKESGAAISQTEYDNEDKKYFPQFGDSKEVVKQKAEARKLAIKTLAVQAGHGAKNMESNNVDDLLKKYLNK